MQHYFTNKINIFFSFGLLYFFPIVGNQSDHSPEASLTMPASLYELAQEERIQEKLVNIDFDASTHEAIRVKNQIFKIFLAHNNLEKQAIYVGMPSIKLIWQRMKKNSKLPKWLCYTMGIWEMMFYHPPLFWLSRLVLITLLSITGYYFSAGILLLYCIECTLVGRKSYYSCFADMLVFPSYDYNLDEALVVAADVAHFHDASKWRYYGYWLQEYAIDSVYFLGNAMIKISPIFAVLFFVLEALSFDRMSKAYHYYHLFQTTYREKKGVSKIRFMVNNWDTDSKLSAQLVKLFWMLANQNIGGVSLVVGFYLCFYQVFLWLWVLLGSQKAKKHSEASTATISALKPVLLSNPSPFTFFSLGFDHALAQEKMRARFAFPFPSSGREAEKDIVRDLQKFLHNQGSLQAYDTEVQEQICEAIISAQKRYQASQKEAYQASINQLEGDISNLLNRYNLNSDMNAQNVMHVIYYMYPNYCIHNFSANQSISLNRLLLMLFGTSIDNQEAEQAIATLIVQTRLRWLHEAKAKEAENITKEITMIKESIQNSNASSSLQGEELDDLVKDVMGQGVSSKIQGQLNSLQQEKGISPRSVWKLLGIISILKIMLSNTLIPHAILPALLKKVAVWVGIKTEKIVKKSNHSSKQEEEESIID